VRSHPIRGAKGKEATDKDMEQNNQRAIAVGKALEILVPYLDIYIPGEHDEFVVLAYKSGKLSEDSLLAVDCEILAKRDLLIVYDWQGGLSNGMITEINFAKENNIPLFSMTQLAEFTIDGLKLLVEEIKIKKERINEYGLGE